MFDNCKMRYREPEGGHLFRVVLGGDVCPESAGSGLAAAGGSAGVLAGVAGFVRSADLRIVQWETPTASEEAPIRKSGPNLNSSAESVDIVRSAGFDIALLANNHIGDHGASGVRETLDQLHARGIRTVGAGETLAAAIRPLTLHAGGKTVKLLNFAENEFGGATADRPGSAPLDPLPNLKQTREAARDADFVIVALHGGHEYNPFPSPRLQELCRAFADAGADLVFNCHTHCMEGVEYCNGAQIVYSPGNLYFPKYEKPLWNSGYLVKCSFDAKGVYELELYPYRFDRERATPLAPSELPLFERYMERLSAPLSDPARLRKLFEAWSTRCGRSYLSGVLKGIPENWETRLDDPECVGQLLPLRNLFCCESHHDMIRCYLRLIEERRVEEAAKLLPEIRAFETQEWMVRTE